MTATVDDSSAFLYNPAGFSRLIKSETQAAHTILFEDTRLDFFAGALPTKAWGVFAAGYLAQNSGGFERRASPLDAPASFSIRQSAFMGGWARAFSLPLLGRLAWFSTPKPLAVGLAFKSISEKIDTLSASGSALDLGVTLAFGKRAAVGAQVQNIVAPELTFVSRGGKYPKVIDVSPSWERTFSRAWRLSVAARGRKIDGEKIAPSGGAELRYHDLLALRAGYNGGPTSGVGLRWGNTQLDYAAVLGDLGISHAMTLIRRFGQTREELERAIIRGIAQFTRGEAERLSKAYIQKAEADLKEERLAEALRGFEAASLWDPQNKDIPKRIAVLASRVDNALTAQLIARTEALAMARYNEGHWLASRNYWQSILEMDPAYARAKVYIQRIGAKLTAEERLRLDAFEAERAGQKARSLLAKARAELDAGRFSSAGRIAQDAWRLDPGNKAAQRFLAAVKRTLEASITERLERAERLAKALDYAAALDMLGSILQDDPDNAKALRKASEFKPALQKAIPAETRKQVEQLYYRGVEHYLKGDYESAASYIRQVVQLDPTYDPARVLDEKIRAAVKATR